jgi:hypothetical protein
MKALQAGPAFPDELAEMTGLAQGTVVNCLTQLKRSGKVETTGEVKGKAQQVRATPSPLVIKGSGDGDDSKQLSSDLRPGESATLEQLQKIRKLVRQGMSEEWAKKTVLASDHPLSCDCEVCR